MIQAPIPTDEEERLADLHRLEILLRTPEESLDGVTRELARIFELPGAFITFMEADTQYFKSAVGLPPEMAVTRTEPRAVSVCNHVIGSNCLVVVEDLLADERFSDNPRVLASGARFYAGTPLRADSGRPIGSLCIVDVKPRTMGEREKGLLQVIADGVMAQVKLQGASRKLVDRTTQIEQDLGQAVRVQRFLLPPAELSGEGWCVRYLYRPVEHLGGDFLDVHQRPDGRLVIFLADVSGHGTSAALTAAMAKTAFLRAATSVETPAQLLSAVHRELVGTTPPGRFMSGLAAFFDPAQRTIAVSSAGHPYPLLIRGSCVETVQHANEMLLLVGDQADYQQQTTLALGPGDRLLIYTDGATEATDPAGDMLDLSGFTRLAGAAARQSDHDFLGDLFARLKRHTADTWHDDVTMVSIESRLRTGEADVPGALAILDHATVPQGVE